MPYKQPLPNGLLKALCVAYATLRKYLQCVVSILLLAL